MASFVLFCFALFALSSQQILANADLIAPICEKTLYKDICESTFAENPESKNADLNGLAEIALDSAIKQSKDIQAKILELSKSSDKLNLQRVTDCSNHYQQAIVEFSKSKGALESKRYLDINIWVSAAMSAGDNCKDGLSDGASLADLNKKYKGICSIVLTISNQLDGKA